MNENRTYAVLSTGGKQYRVEAGQKISVERLPGDVGSEVSFDQVLLIGGGDAAAIKVGTPLVEGAQVKGKILKHSRAPKVITYKKRIKQGFEKKQGHRQEQTEVLVENINF